MPEFRLLRTRDILTSSATGTIGREHHGLRLPCGIQPDVERRVCSTKCSPSTMVETSYMGTWTLGADNATVRNVPEPGAGAIQSRRPIPQLSRINAIRFDGKSIYHGVTFKSERRMRDSYAYNVSYTLSSSKDDASSPGATESEANVPQNVRNLFSDTGEWAHSSFDHRHQFVASGVYELPLLAGAGGFSGSRIRELAHQRHLQHAVRCAVYREPRRGPGQYRGGSGATAGSDRKSESSARRTNSGSMVRYLGFRAAGAIHVRLGAAKQRRGSGIRQCGPGACKDLGRQRGRTIGIPLGDFQCPEPRQLRSSESGFRNSQFRPHLQRKESPGNAVRPAAEFLDKSHALL